MIGTVCVLLMAGLGFYFVSQKQGKESSEPKQEQKQEPKKKVYDLEKYITYTNDKELAIDIYGDKSKIHTYSIENGKVKVTDGKKSYTIQKIEKAISLLTYNFMDVSNTTVVILTETGDIYVRTYCDFLEEETQEYALDKEEDIKKYNSASRIKKMGITQNIDLMPTLILKTEDNRYMRLEEESQSLIETNVFFEIRDITVATDASSNLVDEKGNPLSLSMIFPSTYFDRDNDYVVTVEGYLYERKSNSKEVKRYTDERVKKVEQEGENVVVFFEKGEELKLQNYTFYDLKDIKEETL